MPILNPDPKQLGTTSAMWVTSFLLRLDAGNLFTASLLPYDGAHLAALGGKRVVKRVSEIRQNPQVDSIIGTLVSELQRIAGTPQPIASLSVAASDPSNPVVATIRFAGSIRPFTIPNCFALCASDPQFANVFGSVMGLIATLAGLEIQ
jgi:hypothetical protein